MADEEYCSQKRLEESLTSTAVTTFSEMLNNIRPLNVPFKKHMKLDVLLELNEPHEILNSASGDGVIVVKSEGNVSPAFSLEKPVTVYGIYQRGFDFGYFIAYSEKE